MECLIYSSHDDWPSSDEFPLRPYWVAYLLPPGDFYVVESGFASRKEAELRIAELVKTDREKAEQSE